MNTSHIPEESAHILSWPNGLIIVIIITAGSLAQSAHGQGPCDTYVRQTHNLIPTCNRILFVQRQEIYCDPGKSWLGKSWFVTSRNSSPKSIRSRAALKLHEISPFSCNFETTRNAEIVDVWMNFSAFNTNVWMMWNASKLREIGDRGKYFDRHKPTICFEVH